jgi:LPS export ABC transporter protein LptC
MENVEYVRVRSSDPLARFTAERAERYEKQGLMKLQNFTFEQYGERGREVNVAGEGGNASVDIESGDISMTDGVKIEIGSEDIIMKTNQLDWKDEPRLLYTNEYNEVNIYRENGTSFTGIGLLADARNRTWEFSGIVTGSYINDDDDEDFQLAEGE